METDPMPEPKDCLEIECERDGGHVYEVTSKGIECCAFCGRKPATGDRGHVIDRTNDK